MDESFRLIELLETLRAHGVTHYKDADVEITLGAPPAVAVEMVRKDTGATVNTKKQQYEKLFPGGKAPSFSDFKETNRNVVGE